MRRPPHNTTLAALLAAITLSITLGPAPSPAAAPWSETSAEEDFAAVERLYRELPMEARRLTGPLFWLHGDETPEQLRRTLQKVLEGGNGMFVTESRPHNDWLGPGWYRDLDICVEFARENDLQMIIFDDYWWPSQMMGGRVPPQYGSKVIEASAEKVAGPKQFSESGYGDEKLITVVAGKLADGEQAAGAVDGDTLVNLTASVKDGTLSWDVPPGEWQIMKFTWAFKGPVGAQKRMISVDGASPDCVEWFIENVYQPHYDRYKDDFGKTIVGFFYDEPETQGDWGSDVAVLADERGVDLDKLLVGYKFKLAGDEQTAARHEYLALFAEAWARTMYGGMSRWCRAHGVVSMGHFMEHGNCIFRRDMSGGNMMQLQKYSDIGGIDLVCRQLYPGQRRMDLYQMPKIASSLSHTYDKVRDIALCEIYGAYGQDVTYPQMKWLADWHHVRGVSLLNTHSFNPRAPYDRDCPPYFYNGGFEPRWPLYRVWADYTNRLATMLTGGRHVCPVAFLHLGQSIHVGKAVRPEAFTSTLQDALFDCDWLLYDAWENDAALKGGDIQLHDETYRVLVVPPVEVIPHATLAKAKEFFERGGVVVGYDFLPSESGTVGKDSADIAALREAIWGDAKPGLDVCRTSPAGGRSYFLPAKPSVADVQQVLIGDAGIHPTLEVVQGDTGNWLHVLHRVKAGRDVFLVCNQDHDGDARPFRLRLHATGEPEVWDPMRGEMNSVPFERTDADTVELPLTLEPSESVLIVFRKDKRDLPRRIEGPVKPSREPIEVTRVATPPELAIPRVPQSADLGRSLDGCSWLWYPEDNPAASAQPGVRYFRGGLTVPGGRKVAKATFVGTCDNAFTLFVNGKRAGASGTADEAWRQPTTIDLNGLLTVGENVLAIAGSNLSDAPNPAGLIGRVTVTLKNGDVISSAVDKSWKTSAKEQSGWNQPGFDDAGWSAVKVIGPYGSQPWGRISQRARRLTLSPVESDPLVGHCDLPADLDLDKARVYLEVSEPKPEAAASVKINGEYAGGFIGGPYRLDVTEHLKPGRNEIILEPFAPERVRLLIHE